MNENIYGILASDVCLDNGHVQMDTISIIIIYYIYIICAYHLLKKS